MNGPGVSRLIRSVGSAPSSHRPSGAGCVTMNASAIADIVRGRSCKTRIAYRKADFRYKRA